VRFRKIKKNKKLQKNYRHSSHRVQIPFEIQKLTKRKWTCFIDEVEIFGDEMMLCLMRFQFRS
jgi:hypothetical protein